MATTNWTLRNGFRSSDRELIWYINVWKNIGKWELNRFEIVTNMQRKCFSEGEVLLEC